MMTLTLLLVLLSLVTSSLQDRPIGYHDELYFRPGDALFVVDVQNDFMVESPITDQIPRYPIPDYVKTAGGTKIRAGTLATPDSVNIIPAINNAIADFTKLNYPIFFSLDWHTVNHCSFCRNGTQANNPQYFHPHGAFCPIRPGIPFIGLDNRCQDPRTTQDYTSPLGVMQWPDHCIQMTFGSRFHPYLNVPTNAIVIKKGFVQNLDSYSAIEGGVLSYQGFPFDSEDASTVLYGQPTIQEILQREKIERLFIVGIATDYCVKYTSIDTVNTGLVGEVLVILPLTSAVDPVTRDEAILAMVANNVSLLGQYPKTRIVPVRNAF